MTLATPENVAALDRAAHLLEDAAGWFGKGSPPRAGAICAGLAVIRSVQALQSPDEPTAATVERNLFRAAVEWPDRLYKKSLIEVNDQLGRIPAKHCIEALAAELRSQLP